MSQAAEDKQGRSISSRSGELLGINLGSRSNTNFIPCLTAPKLTAAQLEFGFGGGFPRTPIPPSPSDRNLRLRGTPLRVRFAAPTVAPRCRHERTRKKNPLTLGRGICQN